MRKIPSQKEKHKDDPAYQYEDTISLGPWTSSSYLRDPIHLTFVLARYKFCAKILTGKKRILEVGCGDAFGTPIVAHMCDRLCAIDIDSKIIASNRERMRMMKNIEFKVFDFRREVPSGRFDAVFSIDVIEHIEKQYSDIFMKHTVSILEKDGICIIGTPNITAKKYASPQSKKYHVNWQSFKFLRELMVSYFANTLMFSMNDEVIHTGFLPMAHYLFGVGIGIK